MTTFKRQLILAPLLANLSRAAHVLQILTGPRQVGKTTAMHQFLAEWPEPTHYATADRLAPPDGRWLAETWRRARDLKGRMPLLVVDEIQKVARWSEAVKMLHDEDVRSHEPLRVILLGSSALLLQRGMQESLAGRFQLTHCPHWSYTECRQAFGWTLDQFLFYGGYPGAVPFISDFTAWTDYIRNSLLETVIGRDIPAVHRIDHPALFRQTLALACRHPAEIISLQKLIARNNAIVTALRGVSFGETLADRPFYGRLVENAVGAAFLNAGQTIYYWSERDKEVDFVVQRGPDLLAVEVTAGAGHPTPGLKTFMNRYPEAEPVLIGGAHSDLSVEQFLERGL